MEEEIKIMEFIDTQVVSYKFKNNKRLFDGDIRGRYISSIVALEFLGIMNKNENTAKMYPVRKRSLHPIMYSAMKSKNHKIGRHTTDKSIIDFNGEFDSIIIYSNEAISEIINKKDIETLLLFARNSLEKEDYKRFRKRANFLISNDITVVPITQAIVNKMQHLYENIKLEYNVKNDYRNSFMDLLILATALEKKKTLITKDKELNKVIRKCCGYLDISQYSDEILSISYREEDKKQQKENNNKGYVNNGWKFMTKKNINV